MSTGSGNTTMDQSSDRTDRMGGNQNNLTHNSYKQCTPGYKLGMTIQNHQETPQQPTINHR